jgi:hypothetical protein
MLRKTFEPKSDEVISGWKKPHKGALYNPYPLQSIITVTSGPMYEQTDTAKL